MKASNVQTGVILYFTKEEIKHVGGIGTKVDFEMGKDTWTIRPNPLSTRSIYRENNNATYPGKLQAPARKDMSRFGASEWESNLLPDRTITVKVGHKNAVSYRTKARPKARAEKVTQTHSQPTISSRLLTLKESIDELNRHKESLGAALDLSVDKQGFVTAVIQYGREG